MNESKEIIKLKKKVKDIESTINLIMKLIKMIEAIQKYDDQMLRQLKQGKMKGGDKK